MFVITETYTATCFFLSPIFYSQVFDRSDAADDDTVASPNDAATEDATAEHGTPIGTLESRLPSAGGGRSNNARSPRPSWQPEPIRKLPVPVHRRDLVVAALVQMVCEAQRLWRRRRSRSQDKQFAICRNLETLVSSTVTTAFFYPDPCFQ